MTVRSEIRAEVDRQVAEAVYLLERDAGPNTEAAVAGKLRYAADLLSGKRLPAEAAR